LSPETKADTAKQWFDQASARIARLGEIELKIAEQLTRDAQASTYALSLS
jgi:hypothetical protein